MFKSLTCGALLWTALLCTTGCGSSTFYSVDTHARGIEQPAVGQNMLAAAPIDDSYRVRLTGGVGSVVAKAGDQGEPSLYTPRQTLNGGLAVRAGSVELEIVGSGTLIPASGVNAPRQGAGYGGLRLRGSPGNDYVRMGIAVEAGLKRYGVQQGTSVICEVVPRGEGWAREDDGDCWASEAFAQDAEALLTGYMAATVYPTVRVVPGVYVFGGVGLSSQATNFVRSRIYQEFEFGPTYEVESEDAVDWGTVVSIVGGLEAQFGEVASLLVNVRTAPFGSVEFDTVAEAGVSLRF